MKYIVKKNRKVVAKFEIETPKNICIDEFVCLRSKAYSFKCKNKTKSKNKMKRISKSQTEHIKFEENKKCSYGEKYQSECKNYFLRSVNRERHLQEIEKSTLSVFDDKGVT